MVMTTEASYQQDTAEWVVGDLTPPAFMAFCQIIDEAIIEQLGQMSPMRVHFARVIQSVRQGDKSTPQSEFDGICKLIIESEASSLTRKQIRKILELEINAIKFHHLVATMGHITRTIGHRTAKVDFDLASTISRQLAEKIYSLHDDGHIWHERFFENFGVQSSTAEQVLSSFDSAGIDLLRSRIVSGIQGATGEDGLCVSRIVRSAFNELGYASPSKGKKPVTLLSMKGIKLLSRNINAVPFHKWQMTVNQIAACLTIKTLPASDVAEEAIGTVAHGLLLLHLGYPVINYKMRGTSIWTVRPTPP